MENKKNFLFIFCLKLICFSAIISMDNKLENNVLNDFSFLIEATKSGFNNLAKSKALEANWNKKDCHKFHLIMYSVSLFAFFKKIVEADFKIKFDKEHNLYNLINFYKDFFKKIEAKEVEAKFLELEQDSITILTSNDLIFSYIYNISNYLLHIDKNDAAIFYMESIDNDCKKIELVFTNNKIDSNVKNKYIFFVDKSINENEATEDDYDKIEEEFSVFECIYFYNLIAMNYAGNLNNKSSILLQNKDLLKKIINNKKSKILNFIYKLFFLHKKSLNKVSTGKYKKIEVFFNKLDAVL